MVQFETSDSLLSKVDIRQRSIAVALGFLIALYLCARCAFYRVFIGYNTFDDEGAMLITLLGLQRGHALYDQVLAMYGPFGFWPKVAILDALHIAVSHDVNRAITWVLYVGGCIATGAGVWRLTGRISLMLVSTMTSCIILRRLCGEPGHPGDVCQLLLGCSLLAATYTTGGHAGFARIVMGVIGGLLLMTKINLGVFYIAALGTTCIWTLHPGSLRTALRYLCVAGMLLLPFLILRPHLEVESVVDFGITYELALLAICIVAIGQVTTETLSWLQVILCCAAAVVAVLATGAVTMLLGTSLHAMLDGVIFFPLRGSALFYWWWRKSDAMLITGFASLFASLCWANRRGKRGATSELPPYLPLLLSIIQVGGAIYLIVVALFDGFEGQEILEAVAPACIWLLLLPNDDQQRETNAFPRIFLAFAGLSQTLGGYPNAGTQQSVGLILSMAAVVVGMNDGLRRMTLYAPLSSRRFIRHSFGVVATLAIGCFGLKTIHDDKTLYNLLTPLELPGSSMIRVGAADATSLENAVSMVKCNCDGFMTLPGMNSFYLWTGMLPPTWVNVTWWMNLTQQQQRDNFAALSRVERPGILYDPSLVLFWTRDQQRPMNEPIVQLMGSQYRPVAESGEWTLLLPDSRTTMNVPTGSGGLKQIVLSPQSTRSSR